MTPKEYYHHDTGYPVGDVVKAWKKSYNLRGMFWQSVRPLNENDSWLVILGFRTRAEEEANARSNHWITSGRQGCPCRYCRRRRAWERLCFWWWRVKACFLRGR